MSDSGFSDCILFYVLCILILLLLKEDTCETYEANVTTSEFLRFCNRIYGSCIESFSKL